MAMIGETLGYQLLQRLSPDGTTKRNYCSGAAYEGRSKLEVLFGQGIFEELAGKVVLDFGCGLGATSVELAQRGARHVIGLDIQDRCLDAGRRLAADAGATSVCEFTNATTTPVDVVISLDAFEHFDDPAAILRQIRTLLRPGGYALVAFGPTWYHPLGGHLFSVFPWCHLLFTEAALIRWRRDFCPDGATRFREVAGGLNMMTIRRWEALVNDSGLRFARYELRPIKQARHLHNRFTREFLTATVVARLIPP